MDARAGTKVVKAGVEAGADLEGVAEEWKGALAAKGALAVVGAVTAACFLPGGAYDHDTILQMGSVRKMHVT